MHVGDSDRDTQMLALTVGIPEGHSQFPRLGVEAWRERDVAAAVSSVPAAR
jgi:hypothetical protein